VTAACQDMANTEVLRREDSGIDDEVHQGWVQAKKKGRYITLRDLP